jgi:chromosome segregation ATPase
LDDTGDQLQKLEEKVLKACELFEQTQGERRALQQALEKLRAESRERVKAVEAHEQAIVALRREREEVRTRLEKLLRRIDALTTAQSSG